MEIKHLAAFVAACEAGSFSAAAQRRGVNQSTLSSRIADLEKALGARLFDRGVRPMTLTRVGEILLRHARVVLRELETADLAIKQLHGELAGDLRLGSIEIAGLSAPCFERALAEFQARQRFVKLVINDPGSRAIVEGIQRGQFDLGLVGYRRSHVPADLGYLQIADREVLVVVARNHPLALQREATLAQLAECGPSVELRDGTGLRLVSDAAYARAGVVRHVGVEVATTVEAVRYAAFGFGYALVPDSVIAGRQHGGSISVLKIVGDTLRHPIAVVYQEPQPVAPAAIEMLAQLRTTCGSDSST